MILRPRVTPIAVSVAVALCCTDCSWRIGFDAVPTDGPEAPVVTLAGDAVIRIIVGDSYGDAGASATDDQDGDLSGAIVITGTVDTSVPGTYVITYEVTDSDGNVTTVTRQVEVVAFDILHTELIRTGDAGTINVRLTGSGVVHHVVLSQSNVGTPSSGDIRDWVTGTIVNPLLVESGSVDSDNAGVATRAIGFPTASSSDLVYLSIENPRDGLWSDVISFVAHNGSIVGRFNEIATSQDQIGTGGNVVAAGSLVRYDVYLPPDYGTTTTDYPTILFVHGWGERGDGTFSRFVSDIYNPTGARAAAGFPRYVRQGQDFSFIIITPQCTTNDWNCTQWSPPPAWEALQHASEKYRIDPTRVYVTGLSFGGTGAYNIAATYPSLFAAVAPIATGSAYLINPTTCPVEEVAVWAFHNATDVNAATVVQNTIDLVANLRACPYVEAPQATLYYNPTGFTVPVSVPPGIAYVESAPQFYNAWPGSCHGGWDETYANPAFYDWLLAHQR